MNVSCPLQVLAKRYQENRYLSLPQFISEYQAKNYNYLTLSLPKRRVICGDQNISWSEQVVSNNQALFQFFNSAAVTDLVSAALGLNVIEFQYGIQCWISRYKEGEYINPHRDRLGTVQLLLCLQSSEEENGGYLTLKQHNKENTFFLKSGDAILFEATSIEHFTTPLTRSKRCNNPSRVVAVARYYLGQTTDTL